METTSAVHGPLSRSEPLFQPEAVLDGVSHPVVVEVGEYLDLTAPFTNTRFPALEFSLGVIAVSAAASIVETDECPVGREHVGLERALRMVSDDEGDAVPAKKCIDLLCEPAGMAELEAVPARWQAAEGAGQPLVVAMEVLGQLPEDGAHLR